jgi:tubulin binding cofactor A
LIASLFYSNRAHELNPATMPAPSQLYIKTQVVQRLVKEEKSYHAELERQKQLVERQKQLVESQKLRADMASEEGTDENAEYLLKQYVRLFLPSLLIAFFYPPVWMVCSVSFPAYIQC